MIYENWIGVFNKKGELMSVDESPEIAKANSALLEIEPNYPTNIIEPVTIIRGNLLDLVTVIIDGAKQKVTERRLQEIAQNAREFKKEQKEEKEPL